jgi:hypothetical protein
VWPAYNLWRKYIELASNKYKTKGRRKTAMPVMQPIISESINQTFVLGFFIAYSGLTLSSVSLMERPASVEKTDWVVRFMRDTLPLD